MLLGVVLTVRGFYHPQFFNRWLFRSLHLGGILLVATLELLGEYCPLTVWENQLRRAYDPTIEYPGSFIIGYLERLIYYEVPLWVVILPTMGLAIFTLIVFIARPPARFWRRR